MHASFAEIDSKFKENWRKEYGFLSVFYFNVFIASASFSIVLPSLWPYLNSFDLPEIYLAIVLFAFSFGEATGALAFGHTHNKLSTKTTLFIVMGIGLAGSILYFLASYFEKYYFITTLILARCFQGIWSGGQQAVEQSYVSEVVGNYDKLKVQSEIGIANILGWLLGPILGFCVSFLNITILNTVIVDNYTSIGYLQALLIFVMFVWTLTSFKEIKQKDRPNRSEEKKQKYMNESPNKVGIGYCIYACIVVFNSFSVQETITTPIVVDPAINHFDWTVQAAYGLYGGYGVISILTFILVHNLDGKVDDRTLMLVSLFSGAIGWFCWIDFQYRQIWLPGFFIGFFLVSMSFAMGRNVMFSMFSKIIGKRPAGGYIGFMLAAGAVSRMLSPFWAVNSLKVSLKICMITGCGLFIVAALLLILLWNRCCPNKDSKNDFGLKISLLATTNTGVFSSPREFIRLR